MKILFYILGLIMFTSANAQTINVDDPNNKNAVNLNGINGEPFNTVKYVRVVDGSVYIPNEFTKATLLLKNNKRPINDVTARINIVDHTLHYLDQNGNELFTRMTVEEIYFVDKTTGVAQIFTQTPDCDNNKAGWYEIMEKGKLILYREISKTVSENKPYGSATIEQKVNTYYNYWMKTSASCLKVNKIKDFISELKKINPAIEAATASQKYSDKKSEDWLDVAKKFNAL